MKAVYLEKAADFESLVLGELAQPSPGPGEVLVKVHAAAVTPSEFEWFPTFHTPAGRPRPFPVVLGHEFSGVIAAVGAGVSRFRPGNVVYGLNDWHANGAQAEFCVAPAAALAPKPRLLDPVAASVVPLSALTAWQALIEKAALQYGQRVLIHGAAGGVGVFAVQLARWRGAHVIATACETNAHFVHLLGADEVINYHAFRFEDVARHVDVVLDCVGGETLERSWSVLSKGGRLVSIAAQSAGSSEPRVRNAFMLVAANGAQLEQISTLIDAGEIRPFVEAIFPLSAAREAYARARKKGRLGKITLSLGGCAEKCAG